MDSWSSKKYWDKLAFEIKADGQLGRALPDDAPGYIVKWVSEIEKNIAAYCFHDHQGTVLDAGCGNASFLKHAMRFFPEKKFKYVGLDFSENMLGRGIREADVISNASFMRGSISSLPFKHNLFDRIICSGVVTCLESVEDIDKTLEEFHRVLKPMGVLVFDIFNGLLPKTIAKSIVRHSVLPRPPKYISPLWIFKRLQMAQFDIVSYRGFDFRPTAGYMTYRGLFKFLNPGFIQEKLSTVIERKITPYLPSINLFGSRIYIRCKPLK